MIIDKKYILTQHTIMCRLEEKAHKKKLEFERLLEQNQRGNITSDVHLKNHKRIMKLHTEIINLMNENKRIQSELREQIKAIKK